jgi:hypothetical protein
MELQDTPKRTAQFMTGKTTGATAMSLDLGEHTVRETVLIQKRKDGKLIVTEGDSRDPDARAMNKLYSKLTGAYEDAIELGGLLLKKKASVGHGNWDAWVEANLKFSGRTATNYMRLCENLPLLKSENVSDLTEAYRVLRRPKALPEPKPDVETKVTVEPAKTETPRPVDPQPVDAEFEVAPEEVTGDEPTDTELNEAADEGDKQIEAEVIASDPAPIKFNEDIEGDRHYQISQVVQEIWNDLGFFELLKRKLHPSDYDLVINELFLEDRDYPWAAELCEMNKHRESEIKAAKLAARVALTEEQRRLHRAKLANGLN